MKRYILCAAIHYKDENQSKYGPINISKGFVLSGYRHSDIMRQAKEELKIDSKGENVIQGFLTNDNLFVNRTQAMAIAHIAKQTDNKRKILLSEDLY